MNDQERELDLMVAELEQENRLLRARNDRLEAEQHLQALHDENVRLGLYAYEASMQSNDRMTVDPINGYVSIGTVAQQKQDESDELTIAYMSGLYDGKKQPKQEQGEPVAWKATWGGETKVFLYAKPNEHDFDDVTPLYTTPQQRTWVGLTDEEFQWCNDENWPMVRVAEMLKEKNNG